VEDFAIVSADPSFKRGRSRHHFNIYEILCRAQRILHAKDRPIEECNFSTLSDSYCANSIASIAPSLDGMEVIGGKLATRSFSAQTLY